MDEKTIDIHDVQDWLAKATPEEIQDTISFARGALASRPKRKPRKSRAKEETAQERLGV